jgi:capsular polysaccharide biosynthesis protein
MASPAELLGRLLRQGGVLAGAVLLGVLAGAMYSVVKAPAYTADAQVVVVNSATATDDTTAVKFAQAYGRITGDSAILSQTPTVRAGGSVTALRGQIRAETSPDAPLVQITGTAPNAARAAQVANEVAAALISFGNTRSASTGARLASFAQASAPEQPSSPNRPVDIAVGAAAGLLIGGFATTAGVGGRRRRREAAVAPAAAPAAPPAAPQPNSGLLPAPGLTPAPAEKATNGSANGANGIGRGMPGYRLPAASGTDHNGGPR